VFDSTRMFLLFFRLRRTMPGGYAFLTAAACHEPRRLPPELVPSVSRTEARKILRSSSGLARLDGREIIERIYGSDQWPDIEAFIRTAEDQAN